MYFDVDMMKSICIACKLCNAYDCHIFFMKPISDTPI